MRPPVRKYGPEPTGSDHKGGGDVIAAEVHDEERKRRLREYCLGAGCWCEKPGHASGSWCALGRESYYWNERWFRYLGTNDRRVLH